MAVSLIAASLALAGSAAALPPGLNAARQAADTGNATAASNITLIPIIESSTRSSSSAADALAPQSNVTLPYGINGTNYANITFTTTPGAVKLEAVNTITAVDCSANTVGLTFDDVTSLNAAYAEWSAYQQLVLVTNHLGDCDTELERSFFLATSFASYESNLTLVASAEKKNVADIASSLRANFTGIPGSSAPLSPSTTASNARAKRDIVIDTGDATINADWDLPTVTLLEYPPYITATADVDVDVAVTLSGYLDFDIWTLSLEALYVDVTTSASADLVVDLDVAAAYNDTFSYSTEAAYHLVDIVGILTFGPAVSVAVGASVSASAALAATARVGAALEAATLHLDLVDVDGGTTASGWDAPLAYGANLTLAEAAELAVAPFAAVTVGLDFDVLGGLLNLGAGLTPQVSFPVTAALAAGQEVGTNSSAATVTVTELGAGGTCSDGVEVSADFVFTLDAYVTQFWEATLYNYSLAIADECYSWE